MLFGEGEQHESSEIKDQDCSKNVKDYIFNLGWGL